MCIVEPYLFHDYEHSEVQKHGGEGWDVITTGESPPSPNGVGGYTEDKINHTHIEQALLNGFGILLPVHLEGRGEGPEGEGLGSERGIRW